MAKPVRKDEVETALQARAELGAAYEDEIAESLVARIEQRLDERRPAGAPARDRDKELGLAIVSIIAAVPLVWVAGKAADIWGIVAVCAALVLVNVLFRR